MDAVAPVNIKVGGCLGLFSLAFRRSGRTAWEKWKAPALKEGVSFSKGFRGSCGEGGASIVLP